MQIDKEKVKTEIIRLSEEYNNMLWFKNDPIIFPRSFAALKDCGKASLKDVEVSAVLSSHLAWGRREMVVRDCKRVFSETGDRPYEYIMAGRYRSGKESLHRTVRWSDFASICNNLKNFYSQSESLESLTADEFRIKIFGQKPLFGAANKKIHMLRRWMIRNDGIVDLGLWKKSSPRHLIIPLDVHVHRSALEMGITNRKSADLKTALEITEFLKTIFPDDPCKGDFALFAFQASVRSKK